ncbi:uncharacterized protein NDAI_0G01000 [Naumovozyma dairenensis CBS 421]|uniref:Uncharacterized protein n=1 Tax=Naumovozyma dairenensis (strain ATCC 10597 / BCRC 20456 / CBS 421 / NBRC 0211 / NRRL Y-12639) TaxID=1071378 RepID=G0WDL5_NAUDC|nr:hypothetical protein NDAI_0G01000 [Naumovozyma dairenensis CBS 421]CCD25876.2 hypothetical protein NDAI_0G01000 [Naumovozyma dairenensis CBS 421]
MELPLQLTKKSALQKCLTSDGILLRERCIKLLDAHSAKKIDALLAIDTFFEYGNILLTYIHADEIPQELSVNTLLDETIEILIDIAFYHENIILNLLQRAYDTPDLSSTLWSKSGCYLKNGLGILDYLSSLINKFQYHSKYYELMNQLSLEFKLLQQLSIIVLSLSKLRSKIYNEKNDAILDFQEEDLRELASNSSFYAKICIGCRELLFQHNKKEFKSLLLTTALGYYLDSLTFLLLSMDQYNNDECGIAIGMLEQSIKSLSGIIPLSELNTTILNEKTIKKKDIFKLKIQSKKNPLRMDSKITNYGTKTGKNNNNNTLIPVLQDSLDDFVIPLITLLRYRYNITNEKLSFKPVENDRTKLERFFPRGKIPDLNGTKWVFHNNKLVQEGNIVIKHGQQTNYF